MAGSQNNHIGQLASHDLHAVTHNKGQVGILGKVSPARENSVLTA